MENLFSIILGITMFGIIAILGLFFTNRVQDYMVVYYASKLQTTSSTTFYKWIKSKAYLVVLKIIGVVSLLVFILLVFGILASNFK